MSKSKTVDKAVTIVDNRCKFAGCNRTTECSRHICGKRKHLTAAPPEDTEYLVGAEGCSVTPRRPGAE